MAHMTSPLARIFIDITNLNSPKERVPPLVFPILTTLSHKAKWLGIALDPSLLHIHCIQPTYKFLLFLQNSPESIWFFPVFPWIT